MQIKVCPKCGGHNLETALYCANPACGETLAASDAVEIDDASVHFVSPGPGESRPEQAQTPPPLVTSPLSQTPIPNKPGNGKSITLKITFGCLGILLIISCLIALLAGMGEFRYGGIGNGINYIITLFAEIFGGSLGVILILACSFAPLIFWIWTLVDCVKNEASSGNDKIVWVLVIFFTNFIGAFLYILIRRPERKRIYGY